MVATLFHARSGNSFRAAIGTELSPKPIARQLLDLTQGDHKSAEHLVRNPVGAVPVYVEDDKVLTQSGAILILMVRRWQPNLIPDDAWQCSQVEASFLTAVGDIAAQNAHMRYMDFDERNVEFLSKRLLNAIRAAFINVGSQRYLFGDELSLADLAHYPVIHMRRALLEQAGDFQAVLDWADKVRQFPAVARAIDYAALELPA